MEETLDPRKFHVFGLQMNPDYLVPGTTIAYFYKGKIHVGVTETGLNAGNGKFTVRNSATDKIEYPYTAQVIKPETDACEVETQFRFKPLL